MKVGFGAAGKKKKKGGKKKGGKNKKDGGDAAMADAAPAAPATPQPMGAEDDGATGAPTAKERQRGRMELKKALKVKVAGLKAHRNKLTKLAGNKDARRALNTQMRSLVKEQLGMSNGSGAADGGSGAMVG